jgi:hypothetical protein
MRAHSGSRPGIGNEKKRTRLRVKPGPGKHAARRSLVAEAAGGGLGVKNAQVAEHGLGHLGLADAIVDLVSTGGTLKANNLTPVEHILDISSQLIVNQAALKLKHAAIRPVIDAFAATVKR